MARRNDISDELSRLKEENSSLKSELERLRKENEELKSSLANVQRGNEELKNRIAEMEKGLGVTVQAGEFIKSSQRDLINVHQYAIKQETDTTYVISDLNIQLKALVTQRGNMTVFSLPASKEDLAFKDAMSTISINMKPIPLLTQPRPKASVPVESIEGIGTKIGSILRSRNINTVRDLALADVKDLISVGISEKMAREFVGMARLMVESEFAGIEGIDAQAAELLVRAGKVDSKEKLAESDPQELFNAINKGIKKGLVKVPRDYALTLDDVKRWIESARRRV